MSRLNRKEIQSARKGFWISWTLFISIPASLGTLWLTGGILWASLVTVGISVAVGYNVFENWLDRRQFREDNKLVLCLCGHPEETHGMTKMRCEHLVQVEGAGYYRKDCPCTHYTPRFWQMSRRT